MERPKKRCMVIRKIIRTDSSALISCLLKGDVRSKTTCGESGAGVDALDGGGGRSSRV